MNSFRLFLLLAAVLFLNCSTSYTDGGGAVEDGNVVRGVVRDTCERPLSGALVEIVSDQFNPIKDSIPKCDSVRTDSTGAFVIHSSLRQSGMLWIVAKNGLVASNKGTIPNSANLDITCSLPSSLSIVVPSNQIGKLTRVGIIGTPFVKAISGNISIVTVNALAPCDSLELVACDSSGNMMTLDSDLCINIGSSVIEDTIGVIEMIALPGITHGATALSFFGDTLVWCDSSGLQRFIIGITGILRLDNPLSGQIIRQCKHIGDVVVCATSTGISMVNSSGSATNITSDTLGGSLGGMMQIAQSGDSVAILVGDDGSLWRMKISDGVVCRITTICNMKTLSSDQFVVRCAGDSGLFSIHIDSTTQVIKESRPFGPLPPPHIACYGTTDVWVTSDTNLWLSKTIGMVIFSKPVSNIPDDRLSDLQVSPDSVLWTFALSGSVDSYDGKKWRVFDSNNSPLSGTNFPQSITLQGATAWVSSSQGSIFKIAVK